MPKLIFSMLTFALLAVLSVNAYFNVTYINTTVILNSNNSAHVVESLNLFISNSSINQYLQDRPAINLSLSDWQTALGTSYLVEHILNPKSSVYAFTFLPGPISYSGTDGNAQLTMSYYVNNVTTVQEIAPRKFQYTFNNSVFNFAHAASGATLPQIARLNIITPQNSQIVSINPVPDYPKISFVSNYTGSTTFSWYGGTLLSSFTLSYIITQSPGQEVLNYFSNVYANYTYLIYALIGILVLAVAIYLYIKVFHTKV
jgi:hypothetical protein